MTDIEAPATIPTEPQGEAEASEVTKLEPGIEGEVESFEKWKARQAKAPEQTKAESKETKEPKDDQGRTSKEARKEETQKAKEEDTDKNDATPRRFKIKADGVESEVDEEEIVKLAQLGKSSSKRFEEAAKLRGQAENFIRALKENPGQVLLNSRLGIDRSVLEEFATNLLYERIQQEQMTDEQRQIQRQQQELEQYRRQMQEQQESEKEQRETALRQRYQEEYKAKISQALQDSGLPVTDWTFTRMAGYMRQAMEKGMDDITPNDVAKYVAKDWAQAQRDFYTSLDGQKLVEHLGDDVVDKIRKHTVQKYKDTRSQPQVQPGRMQGAKPQKTRFTSAEQMMEALQLR